MSSKDARVLLRWLVDTEDPEILHITAQSLKEYASTPEGRDALKSPPLNGLPVLVRAARDQIQKAPQTAGLILLSLAHFVQDPGDAAVVLLQLGCCSLGLGFLPTAPEELEAGLAKGLIELASHISPANLGELVESGEVTRVCAQRCTSFLQARALGLFLLAVSWSAEHAGLEAELRMTVERKLGMLACSIAIDSEDEFEGLDPGTWCKLATSVLEAKMGGAAAFAAFVLAHCATSYPEGPQWLCSTDSVTQICIGSTDLHSTPGSAILCLAALQAVCCWAQIPTEHATAAMNALCTSIRLPPTAPEVTVPRMASNGPPASALCLIV